MNIGIDGLGVSFPRTYVELEELAAARGIPPGKYSQGLGTVRMAVPELHEDTVTLAAQAARSALEATGTDGAAIGLLAVGTETAVDHSKPVASYVQGLLGFPTTMRVFETKHACYGGTAALQLALDWIRSGRARGRKALVICADIARYGVGTPGEPTQGAGAVAILLSESPRLLAIEPNSGVFSQDVHDFWRPLYSKDAQVDGHYSVQCYLDALTGAYADFRTQSEPPLEGKLFSDQFSALLYHVPYGKMAVKAHRQLRGLDGDATPDASFERLVGPSLELPRQIGNVYTGSLYLSLASLLSCAPRDLSGERVGLFSYGSGSCAEFFSGRVVSGAQEHVRGLGLLEALGRREKLTVEAYETLMAARAEHDTLAFEERGGEDFRFLGVKDHRRVYARPEGGRVT